mmetsp:Transcript_2413/g.3689  ORF Transcript_2413/g.3689 Transcript_2413/m.3689 type:complete len:82 (-) Transcript_2413:349-594(-)
MYILIGAYRKPSPIIIASSSDVEEKKSAARSLELLGVDLPCPTTRLEMEIMQVSRIRRCRFARGLSLTCDGMKKLLLEGVW